MIQAIDLNKLRNAEFIQFSKDFTTLINANNPATLSVQSQYDTMVFKLAELEGLFKNMVANPITAEMEALDLRRDQAINGITALINAHSYHFNTDTVNASILLQNNLKLYGTGIARENYQSETAILNNLIADWETKPELTNAVYALQLTTWIAELKSANQLFNEKYLARTQMDAAAPTESQKGKRTEVMAAYYELRKFLNAFAVIQPLPIYEKTINEVNALIEKYHFLLKNRTSPKTVETEQVAQ